MNDNLQELNDFIVQWEETQERNREVFLRLKTCLESLPGVSLTFLSRPGVTYSLRAVHERQQDRPLFAMVDVIEDQPRWLSVCFFGDMVADPEELGDFVPEGLLGQDALCFDIPEHDDALVTYVEARLTEAGARAAQSS